MKTLGSRSSPGEGAERKRGPDPCRGAGNGSYPYRDSQGWLRDLGLSLSYDVWIAANDRNRQWQDGKLRDGCLSVLPGFTTETQGAESVYLINVLWLDRESHRIVAAFEVEHLTTIYSGIVRMLDLALGSEAQGGLFLVASDKWEADVREQLRRPTFSRIADLKVRDLPYGALEKNREAIELFGHGLKPIQAISHQLMPA